MTTLKLGNCLHDKCNTFVHITNVTDSNFLEFVASGNGILGVHAVLKFLSLLSSEKFYQSMAWLALPSTIEHC